MFLYIEPIGQGKSPNPTNPVNTCARADPRFPTHGERVGVDISFALLIKSTSLGKAPCANATETPLTVAVTGVQ
jgi:hypothetical protein